MIGQDIPGYLPDPPDGVSGLGSSRATEEGTFNGGGLNKNSTRPSISAGTGDGIVMGAHAWASCSINAVSYTHLRAHETVLDLVCRLLLEKKKKHNTPSKLYSYTS